MSRLLFVLGASIVLASSIATAQHPGEECQWQCEVVYCDYYYDYCDYDCHEVCYPYSPQDPLSAGRKVPVSQWSRKSPQLQQQRFFKVKLDNGPLNPDPIAKKQEQPAGKVVKMRIQNPSFQVMRGQEIIATRGSPPIGLAVFQSCLSDKNMAQTPSWDSSAAQKGVKSHADS